MKNYREIANDLLDVLTKSRINGVVPKKFVLRPDHYRELMKHPSFCVDRSPRPPICAKADWSSSGLFSSGSGHYEARDYHAPEYLKALKKYELEQKKDNRPRIWGIPIEVKVDPKTQYTL